MAMLTARTHLDDCVCGKDHQGVIRDRSECLDSGCWRWILYLNEDGYGMLRHARIPWVAHRFSYIAFVGPIPDGMTVDHLCRNTACVNPDHLEAVTARENIQRGYVARGFTPVAARPPRRPYLSRADVAPDDPRHGTRSGYVNLRCRCVRCRAANAAYKRAFQRSGIDDPAGLGLI